MDIARMSTMLSTAKVQQQANISVMKMTMDSAKMSAQTIKELANTSAKTMERSVNPSVGSIIDVKL